MEKRKIKVIIKEPYKDAVVKEIVDDLKTIQGIVGGYIEVVSFPTVKGVDLVVNEEGKLDKLAGNFFIPHYEDCVVGACMITGYNDEGEFISLTEDQIKKVSNYINNYKLEYGEDVYEDLNVIRNKAIFKMKRLESEM